MERNSLVKMILNMFILIILFFFVVVFLQSRHFDEDSLNASNTSATVGGLSASRIPVTARVISVDNNNQEMSVRVLDADFNISNYLVLDCSNFNINISGIKEGDLVTFLCFENSFSESKIKVGELIEGTLYEEGLME